MSVLDRAIVKAFERRSRSASAETEAVADMHKSAQAIPLEVGLSKTQLADSHVTANSTTSSNPAGAFDISSQSEIEQYSVPNQSPPQNSSTGASIDLPVHPSPPSSDFAPPMMDQKVGTQSSSSNRDIVLPPVAPEPTTIRSEIPAANQTVRSNLPIEPTAPKVQEPPQIVRAQPEVAAKRPVVSVSPPTAVVPLPPAPQAWKWPEICEQLDQFTGEGFQQLAKHLQFAAEQGHKVLAFVSSQREAGRTSVLLTLTRILALEGKSSVLLIDADHRHPNIATLTGIQPQACFDDVLQGSTRVSQATNPMTPGRVSVLPLMKPVTDGDWKKAVTTFRVLLHQARRDYDMILIDAGVFSAETKLPECWLRGVADAAVTVSRQLSAQMSEHVVLDWKQIGIESLGVIETFA